MNNSDTKEKINSSADLLQKTFQCIYGFVSEIVGREKARKFSETSYQTIEKYFRNLSAFELKENSHINVLPTELSEREILAFSVWMQQFLKELKEFMIGLGQVDPVRITIEFREQLEAIGFYDFFEQAKELNY